MTALEEMSKRSVLYNGNNRSPKTPDQLTLRSILGRLLTRPSMADTCCQTELFYTPLTWKKRHFFYTRNLLHSPQIVVFLSPRERRWLLSLRPESPEKASSSPVFSLLSSRCCFCCFFFSLQTSSRRDPSQSSAGARMDPSGRARLLLYLFGGWRLRLAHCLFNRGVARVVRVVR